MKSETQYVIGELLQLIVQDWCVNNDDLVSLDVV